MAPCESFRYTYTQYIRNKQYFATIRMAPCESLQDTYMHYIRITQYFTTIKFNKEKTKPTRKSKVCILLISIRNINAFRNIRMSLSTTELK